jgi:hypothetical protein
MDHFNNPGMSPARRRAASMIRQTLEEQWKLPGETERLRELRLAKEPAEKESKESKPVRRQREGRAEACDAKNRNRCATRRAAREQHSW